MITNDGFFSDNDWRYYLSHHGIIGQKWGQRNGPPYPLSQKTSQAVKSSGYKEKYLKDRKTAQRIAEGKTRSKSFRNVGTGAISDMDQTWQEMFTKDGGELVSPTAVMREKYENYDDMSWDDSKADFMRKYVSYGLVNPSYGQPGTTNNCTKATFVTELVRRGIEDYSAGRQSYPASGDAMSYWFDGAVREQRSSIDAYESLIDSFGSHASGSMNVLSQDESFGHCVHWTKSGDKFSIEDGQCGRIWEGSSFSKAMDAYTRDTSLSPFSSEDGAGITRLDNCKINWSNAEEDSCFHGNALYNKLSGRII